MCERERKRERVKGVEGKGEGKRERERIGVWLELRDVYSSYFFLSAGVKAKGS